MICMGICLFDDFVDPKRQMSSMKRKIKAPRRNYALLVIKRDILIVDITPIFADFDAAFAYDVQIFSS